MAKVEEGASIGDAVSILKVTQKDKIKSIFELQKCGKYSGDEYDNNSLEVSEENIKNGYKNIEKFRKRAGLSPYSDNSGNTVASVVVNGKTYFGVNSSITQKSKIASRKLREKWLKEVQWIPPKKNVPKHLGHAQSLTHAETHALIRAYERQRILPQKVTMYVDRKTCNICRGELPALLKRIGVKELKIFSGGSKKPITIKAIE